MTAGKVMLAICVVSFAIGTFGLVKHISAKRRQRQMEKRYAALREAEADNE